MDLSAAAHRGDWHEVICAGACRQVVRTAYSGNLQKVGPGAEYFRQPVLAVVVVPVMVRIAPTLSGVTGWLPITCVLLAPRVHRGDPAADPGRPGHGAHTCDLQRQPLRGTCDTAGRRVAASHRCCPLHCLLCAGCRLGHDPVSEVLSRTPRKSGCGLIAEIAAERLHQATIARCMIWSSQRARVNPGGDRLKRVASKYTTPQAESQRSERRNPRDA